MVMCAPPTAGPQVIFVKTAKPILAMLSQPTPDVPLTVSNPFKEMTAPSSTRMPFEVHLQELGELSLPTMKATPPPAPPLAVGPRKAAGGVSVKLQSV